MTAFREMRPGESLDTFHQRCVVPTPQETVSRNAEIDVFVRFLHSKFAPAEVRKSGSLGKGTAVRGCADIDLVVILKKLRSIEELQRERPRLLSSMTDAVNCHPWRGQICPSKSSKFSLSYTLNGEDLDVLPALDIQVAYGSNKAVYSKMTGAEAKDLAMQFSVSLAPLQIDFVKPRGEDMKRVIRLLKYWKNEREVDIRSYTLELLTIYAASRQGGVGISTDRLFREVITLLANCHSLRVSFDTYYDSSFYTRNLPAPYVLDPANPYMNTLHGKNAGSISSKANEMLRRL